jgi:hypothetical protein
MWLTAFQMLAFADGATLLKIFEVLADAASEKNW